MSQRALRPRSRGQVASDVQEPGVVSAKVFNCIVDETSLIQGAKKSTRDGIPKWIAAGRMRLFVPLYALDQATRVKTNKGRAATDAGEALEWLDDATTTYPHLVTLQGGYDKFETWAEVEKFALPRTLFSEEDDVDDLDTVESLNLRAAKISLQDGSDQADRSFSSNDSIMSALSNPSNHSLRSASPLSPPTSPSKQAAKPTVSFPSTSQSVQPKKDQENGTKGSQTPRSIQPLLNYILWRVHQETDPAAALDSFIFLSDNPTMRKYAQRFGIRSKTLTEIRYVIARESQDDRNRQHAQQRGIAHTANKKSTSSLGSGKASIRDGVGNQEKGSRLQSSDIDHLGSDEDEILLKRAPKAPAALISSPNVPGRVMDPNQFQRSPGRGGVSQVRGSARGTARSLNATRGRGVAGHRGRHHSVQVPQPSEPIDPDSFARPSSSRGAARGGRNLWSPT